MLAGSEVFYFAAFQIHELDRRVFRNAEQVLCAYKLQLGNGGVTLHGERAIVELELVVGIDGNRLEVHLFRNASEGNLVYAIRSERVVFVCHLDDLLLNHGIVLNRKDF
jgi:hypothetical protein